MQTMKVHYISYLIQIVKVVYAQEDRPPGGRQTFTAAGFLPLPSGRPRSFGASTSLAAAIHFGGRPRRGPLPATILSRDRILSLSASRCSRSCLRIFDRSIF